MNTPASPDPGATGFGDCLVDPGVLTRDDAIYAMCVHFSCPVQCLVLPRAEATLNDEFAPLPLGMPSPDTSAADQETRLADFADLAATLRELLAQPVPDPETKDEAEPRT
ncbi:hypothetical protein [Nocardia sp. NPDC049149]|uniref:hypothetical protein n=1 Tax=Nocardia sp. NPDC049149 TaxID=3364315 RepID=UPI00371DC956